MTDITRPTHPDLRCEDVRELAASFVLGALDQDEADAVRSHLARCTDAHVEMGELGSVLDALAESVPLVEPPSGLKARVLAAAAADLEARDGAKGAVGPTAAAGPPAGALALTPFPAAAGRERRANARSRIAAWPLRIAAVLAITLLGGWNLLLQNQLGDAKTYEQNVAAVLDIAGQPGSLTAVLTGEGMHAPAGLAAVASDGLVRIAMRDLPETSGDHVYEAWAIGSDGVPRALGGFRVGPTGIAYFESTGSPTQDGIVLALTLEPGPGATAPSSPPVSAGTAVAAG